MVRNARQRVFGALERAHCPLSVTSISCIADMEDVRQIERALRQLLQAGLVVDSQKHNGHYEIVKALPRRKREWVLDEETTESDQLTEYFHFMEPRHRRNQSQDNDED